MEQDPVLESPAKRRRIGKNAVFGVAQTQNAAVHYQRILGGDFIAVCQRKVFPVYGQSAGRKSNKQGTKLCNLVDKLLFFNKVEALQPKDLAKKSINLKNLVKTSANDAISPR